MHQRRSLNLIKTATLESLCYFTDKDSEAPVIGDSIILSLNHVLCTINGNVSRTATKENGMAVPKKIKDITTIGSRNPTSGYIKSG